MAELKSLAASLGAQMSQHGLSKTTTHTAAQLGLAFGRQRRWRYAACALLLAGRSDPLEKGWASEVGKCALHLVSDGIPAPRLPLALERAAGQISFVVCSITPSKLAALRANLDLLIPGEGWELIHIDDARSLAEGYNRGLEQVEGELVVLCHDDIVILCDEFEAKLRQYLVQFDVIGVAGSTQISGPAWAWAGVPHLWSWVGHPRDDGSPNATVAGLYGPCISGAQVMDGLFLAGRRSAFDKVRFDAQIFDGFHGYDLDFSYRASMAGLSCGICLDLTVFHESNGNFGEQYRYYANRFSKKFPEACDHEAGDMRLPGVQLANREELLSLHRWLTRWVSMSDEQLLARVFEGVT